MNVRRPLDRLMEVLIGQYHNSPNLIKYIRCFVEEIQELHIALEDAKVQRYLSNAYGKQLDVIGYIVGLPRGVSEQANGVFFGFEGAIQSGTFGTDGDPSVGEVFRSSGDNAVIRKPWDDESYRRYIEAKIMINHNGMDIETLIKVIQKITNLPLVHITEGNLQFNIHMPYSLNDDIRLLLVADKIIPKPVGISVTFSDNDGVFS